MLRTIISIGVMVLGAAAGGFEAYRTRKQLKDMNCKLANVNLMIAQNASQINDLSGQEPLDDEEEIQD